jgi:hypothetical protein
VAGFVEQIRWSARGDTATHARLVGLATDLGRLSGATLVLDGGRTLLR